MLRAHEKTKTKIPAAKCRFFAFFHPDYTVGTGVSPVQLARADFTAGRELHPALKTFSFICLQRYYTTAELFCNIFLFRIVCDII